MRTSGTAGAVPLLLDYLYWLRDRVLETAATAEGVWTIETPTVGSRDLRATLVHELDVEWSWRRRLRDTPYDAAAELRVEDFPTLDSLTERWRGDELEMRAWLESLDAGDLERPCTANGLEGLPLAVYLLHVIEHGVTELAGAAAILHALGSSTGDLGLLDAIDDLRAGTGVGE